MSKTATVEKPEVAVCEESLAAIMPEGSSDRDWSDALNFVLQYEEQKWKRFSNGKDLFKTVQNPDDGKAFHPLPYYIKGEGKATSLLSHDHKQLATFWGDDVRLEHNHQLPTLEQRLATAQYVKHAANCFPLMQSEIDRIYGMEDMPEAAIKAIESLMERVFVPEVPPYAD